MNTDIFIKFLAKRAEIDDLEARLKECKAELARVEESALEEFLQASSRSLNIAGNNIYMQKSLWVSVKASDTEAIEALKESGLGGFIKPSVSTQTLSSWYKEQMLIAAPISETLQPHLKVSEKFELRVRKS